MPRQLALLALLAFFLAASVARAQSPAVSLAHSGFLLGANDQPLNRSVTLSFGVFASDTGGSPLWTATCPATVAGGYYTVTLGSTCGTGLLASYLPVSPPSYLEVAVDGVTVQPRLRLDPAVQAVDSAHLEGLGLAQLDTRYAKVASTAPTTGQVLKWTGAVWAPAADAVNAGTVTSVGSGTGLVGGPITSAGTLAVDVGTGANQIPQLDAGGKLASSTLPTITNAMVADGSLSAAKLATSGATTSGQVLKWTGSAWAPGTDSTGASQWTSGAGGLLSYSGGNVGIGTALPGVPLELVGPNSGTAGNGTLRLGAFTFRHQDVNAFNHLNIDRSYGFWQPVPLLTLRADGNVGINVAEPAVALDVNGQIRGGGTTQLLYAERTASLDGGVAGMTTIPGMTVTLTLTRPAVVRMSAGGTQRSKNAATCHIGYGFTVGGTLRDNPTYGSRIQTNSSTYWWQTWSVEHTEVLAAGTYVITTAADDTSNGCVICGESDGSAQNYATCTMSVLAVSQ